MRGVDMVSFAVYSMTRHSSWGGLELEEPRMLDDSLAWILKVL